MSTGKWTDPSVPHRGWQFVRIYDLEQPSHTCEMCEAATVRYVHEMFHPEYGSLDVGCICAGWMEEDADGAVKREADFKLHLARRARWLNRDWRLSANGNEFVNTHDGFNVVVFEANGTWSARFLHKRSGYVRFSQRPYADADAAKLAAFEAMMHYKHATGKRGRA